jgi:broad specificity phosphatase PhoE
MTTPTTRLTLLCHGATAATRRAAFPVDEPLEPAAARATKAMAGEFGHVDAAWTGPSLRARQTAAELGAVATAADELDDWNIGAWRGRTLAELGREAPAEVGTWLSDPSAAPHGGESLVDVVSRAGRWLNAHAEDGIRILAVTHAAVVRAAIVHALGAPPRAAWRIDVSPLSCTVLHGRGRTWTVRAINDLGIHRSTGATE